MIAPKWFDRKFNFNFGMEQYGNLFERLQNAPKVFKEIVEILPADVQDLKPENKWSVKENIGHLFLLEVLWQNRFQEIKDGQAQMSAADLNNTITNLSSFNKYKIHELTDNFLNERNKTIVFLNDLQQDDFSKSSIHPRLQQPMRIIDLMYFVAEHDQHHLDTILNIINAHWEQHPKSKKWKV